MILRYSDAFLIAAEAEFRLNGPTSIAYGYINAVRTRAQIPILTTDLNLNVILQERAWEFYGEGDRWYDLTRTNTFLTVVPQYTNLDYPVRTPQAKHRYFPIPQIEINANPKLEQNDPWK